MHEKNSEISNVAKWRGDKWTTLGALSRLVELLKIKGCSDGVEIMVNPVGNLSVYEPGRDGDIIGYFDITWDTFTELNKLWDECNSFELGEENSKLI